MVSQFQINTHTPEISESEGDGGRPMSYAESIGVVRVLTETFTVAGYTFTNLADAVAKARRMQDPSVL